MQERFEITKRGKPIGQHLVIPFPPLGRLDASRGFRIEPSADQRGWDARNDGVWLDISGDN
jgi:hypothetical protein